MKKIYLDNEFKCHTTDDGAMIAIETDVFDGMCDFFIEGYRFVPSGETWARDDGVEFHGEMVAPWRDYAALSKAQREYEKELIATYEESLKTVGVKV